MKTKTQTTAAAYAERREDIARLLDVLQMHLDVNDKAHADRPTNWGLVGNLGKVREDLIGVVGFMASMDPEQVVEFLSESNVKGAEGGAA